MFKRLEQRRTARSKARLALEHLEEREVPAVNIVVNYSMDAVANGGSGFFQNNPGAVTVMNEAAQEMGQRVSANLAAIAPGGANTWSATFYNPENGSLTAVANLNVATNTIIVYVGAHGMSGGQVGYGATGGYSWNGYSDFATAVQSRGWSGFTADDAGIWGGSIQFATNANWYFGLDPTKLQANQVDFYSVAVHELGHVLGAGTSPQWMPQVSGTSFHGAHSMAVYGGYVPLAGYSDLGEWADGLTYNGKQASEDPILPLGTRVTWTALDEAALEDVGWNAGTMVSPPVAPPVSPPPASPPPVSPPIVSPPVVSPPPVAPPVVPPPPASPPVISPPVVSPPVVSPPPVSPPVVSPPPVSPPTVTPSPVTPPFTYSPTQGVPVSVYGTSSGVTAMVRVVYTDGTSYSWAPFGWDFTGGDSVTLGDVNGDGTPDIIVASGQGMPGLIQVYDGTDLQLLTTYSPLGNFSGGLNVAAGDLNRDGHADIVVGVKSAGSPFVTVIDGASGTVMDRFQVYPTVYTGGFKVVVADVNHDGYPDVIVAPNTNARLVKAFSGQSIATGNTSPQVIGAILAFSPVYTGAVSVAVGEVINGQVDIVVGSASTSSRVRVFNTALLTPSQYLTVPVFGQTIWSDNTGIQLAIAPSTTTPGQDDLVVTNGNGTRTATLSSSQLTPFGWSASAFQYFDPMAGITTNGIYLG
jgi:hypothetical protein